MKKRQREKGARSYCRQREAVKKWDRIWYNTERRQRAERKRKYDEGRVGGEEKGFQVMTEGVILTVGHTLILDLQILVGPWAGVREDI